MSAVARDIVKDDALALAEYFAARPWPSAGAPAASEADAGAAKAAVCTSCHLERFQGDESVPRLAGQQRDYLLKTMSRIPRRRARQQPRHVGHDEHGCAAMTFRLLAAWLAGR